jgi:uncharacterized circularly permuted ATP-grasp superfamily protein
MSNDNALAGYDPGGYFCEMFGGGSKPPAYTATIRERLSRFDIASLRRRSRDALEELYDLGITFTVYSDRDVIDRILPFDVIPRVISPADWKTIDTGVQQRVAALNLFLKDIYNDRKILKDKVVPADLVLGNANYREEMVGLSVPGDVYVHICGTDIVRDDKGVFRVLEDNARTPSGVSYVIENRHLMLRAFADLTEKVDLLPVDGYGSRLAAALSAVAPRNAPKEDPGVVLMSPGTFNSAYFEHVFLAREMGVPLVEGQDLVVEKDRVFMKTTGGHVPVHVIYRRIDDAFLDPEVFNKESVLGVPGLMRAYRKGNVNIANAVGTGVADDKAIYTYMPRIIKYYLDQEPILQNVQTNICREREGLAYTLEHLDELVTKPVGESGGYGVVIGPRATKKELRELRTVLMKKPDNYISQPMVRLSVSPTLVGRAVEPRHVDLRPFAVTGKGTWVLPGGLTRVAMKRGSLVVNSSQGGGTKDTWVLG